MLAACEPPLIDGDDTEDTDETAEVGDEGSTTETDDDVGETGEPWSCSPGGIGSPCVDEATCDEGLECAVIVGADDMTLSVCGEKSDAEGECPSGEVELANICVALCVDDKDCPEDDMVCDGSGCLWDNEECDPPPEPGCFPGELGQPCDEGSCGVVLTCIVLNDVVSTSFCGMPAFDPEDCEPDQVGTTGTCVYPCEADEDCPSEGMLCQLNTCGWLAGCS